MNVKSTVYQVLKSLPYIGKKLRVLDDCGYEPGHYYSTIPNLEEIRKRSAVIFDTSKTEIKGINLNRQMQFELLEMFKSYYKELPYYFETELATPTRYQVKGAWYTYSDAIMLYSMMRHFQPSNIIEIGSGHSSAIMLDVNEKFLQSKAIITFIDPDLSRLNEKMNAEDKQKHTVIQKLIQDVDVDLFRKLKRDDILFIDSSHVSKTGSDLNHILFEILPILESGVLIHFHDIHFPFELPSHWVLDRKWFWNENYIFRAYLTENPAYTILNFNTYLHREFPDWFRENMPACLINAGDVGSIWIRKN